MRRHVWLVAARGRCRSHNHRTSQSRVSRAPASSGPRFCRLSSSSEPRFWKRRMISELDRASVGPGRWCVRLSSGCACPRLLAQPCNSAKRQGEERGAEHRGVSDGLRPFAQVRHWLIRSAEPPFHEVREVSVVSLIRSQARPFRPRLGMSDRRPTALRAVSILSPQQPSRLSSPGAARHSSRNNKVAPWLPSTMLRPLRGAGRSPPVCRQPSRSR